LLYYIRMSTIVALSELGLCNQAPEVYEQLDRLIHQLDDCDKGRLAFYITTLILKEESKLHPVAIIQLMEYFQKTEIQCASMKKMLGDTIIEGIECKKCGKKLPKMTILHHINNVNSKCPHDEVEVEITKN